MEFIIDAYENIGDLKFNMNRNQVRNILGSKFKEFKKSKFSKTLTDNYIYSHIYYDENELLDAVEFFKEEDTVLILNGNKLFTKTYAELENIFLKLDDKLEVKNDGFTSYKYGVGIYSPDVNEQKDVFPESIIVFKNGYYN